MNFKDWTSQTNMLVLHNAPIRAICNANTFADMMYFYYIYWNAKETQQYSIASHVICDSLTSDTVYFQKVQSVHYS